MVIALLLNLSAGCAPPDPNPMGAAEVDGTGLSGTVQFFSYETWTALAGSFVVGPSTWTPITDGACESGWRYMSGGQTSEEASAGHVDYYLDGVENLWTSPAWAPGANFGARAEGDVFPAFDMPDAIVVPYALDLAWPSEIAADADFVLTWPGPYADRVTVEFNYDTAVDTWSTLTCTFEDDGSATIPAAELADIIDGAPSARVGRSAELATTIDGASLLFQATWWTGRDYSR